jgi:hypothetical protein
MGLHVQPVNGMELPHRFLELILCVLSLSLYTPCEISVTFAAPSFGVKYPLPGKIAVLYLVSVFQYFCQKTFFLKSVAMGSLYVPAITSNCNLMFIAL